MTQRGVRSPSEPRFRAKVNKNGSLPVACPERGVCHEWTGAKVKGYGHFLDNGKRMAAHRYAFFLAHDRWPEPACCHHCDNPGCVNPDHLYEGDQTRNMRDCASRKRAGSQVHPESRPRGSDHYLTQDSALVQGDRNPSARLTNVQVLEIRQLFTEGKTNGQIAEMYSVCKSTISHIRSGIQWSSVPAGSIQEPRAAPKLTREQVLEIRAAAARGESRRGIARRYDISGGMVSHIHTRRVYADIE